MSFTLPNLKVGAPVCHKSVAVFPLFGETESNVAYRLAEEALADKSVKVTEVSESGSVPELMVENQGKERVLFLEGEELVGAKQNRVLNTSVLIAAGSKVKIPVSCVERGRWRSMSQYFSPSGSHSSPKMRSMLRHSVHRSLKEKRGHRSDQGAVWKEVDAMQAASGVDSSTAAMSDVYNNYKELIAEFRERLAYVPDATGMAVAVGDRIVMLDVFDKAETCGRVWSRLLSGLVFPAMAAKPADKQATPDDVEAFLSRAQGFPWERNDAVGEGDEYRSDLDPGEHGSALVLEDAVVHGSVVTAE